MCSGLHRRTPCGFQHQHGPDGDIALATLHVGTFGDAEHGGTGIDVTHTFAAAGTYTVILTVTDVGGCHGTVTQSS